ncbi:ORF6N domain-containing protein [Sediminibacterium soli]|uniref:ORF6N domain-containing protein n=1 Tax=Sediminibacterium soli TaxID=2698829 RepID=UPI001F216208|nr:ORF6N domain-containing protein [Sediminibacterium soli]
MTKSRLPVIYDEKTIQDKVYIIRNQKVMLDLHLAEIYEVETRALNQAVKRNLDRFPADFMFKLTLTEWADISSSQFVMMKYPKTVRAGTFRSRLRNMA